MIKAIITDFDGTLVNTYQSNLLAYQEAFKEVGYVLTDDMYKKCYGYRFDDFCKEMNVEDEEIKKRVKERKKQLYPKFFDYAYVNEGLLNFIILSKANGIKIGLASTASKENLYNMLNHFDLIKYFDVIISGEQVSKGKPDPEVYLKAMYMLDATPNSTLVFEDSSVGIEAADRIGVNYIKINDF